MIDDNFHYMNEDERNEHGVYPTAEEAIAACRRIVDECLKNSYKPTMTEKALYETYQMFGDDPFIIAVSPNDKPVEFQARNYAKARSQVLTSRGDAS
jgi:predicted P-loop ATPase/GTPase